MAKQQSFADKVHKQKAITQCPVCGEALQPTLVLQPVPSARGGHRMKESRVNVCKCNRNEIMG